MCICIGLFVLHVDVLHLCLDAETRLESERSGRQKAEKDLLEMKKLMSSLQVDISQYKQQADTVTQELAAEADKVSSEDDDAQLFLWLSLICMLIHHSWR